MTDRYVDGVSGVNTGAGTTGAPWKTLQYAHNNANAGDTIYIRDATYVETLEISKANMTWQNDTGHNNVIIDGEDTLPSRNWASGTTVQGGRGLTYQGMIEITASGTTIDGITITNSTGRGILVLGASNNKLTNITITNVVIHEIRNQFVTFFDCNGVEISNSTFYRGGLWAPFSRSGGNTLFWNPAFVFKETTNILIENTILHSYWGEGWGFARGSDIIFRYNVVRDIYAPPVYMNRSPRMQVYGNFVFHTHGNNNDPGLPSAGYPNGFDYLRNGEATPSYVVNAEENTSNIAPTSDVEFYNNIGYNCSSCFAVWSSQGTNPTMRRLRVYHNTFVNARANSGTTTNIAISTKNTYNQCIFAQNVVVQNNGNLISGTASGWSFINNGWNRQPPTSYRSTSDIYGNQNLYDDDAVPDETWTAASRVNFEFADNTAVGIDAGLTTYTTIDGYALTRDSSPDLGALEWDGTAPDPGDPGGNPGGGGGSTTGDPFFISHQTAPTSGTQTVVTFDGMEIAPKGLLFKGTIATADNTSGAGTSMFFGMCGSNLNQRVIAFTDEDAQGTSNSYRRAISGSSILFVNPANGAILGEGAITATGVGTCTITWSTTPSSAYKFDVIAMNVTDTFVSSYTTNSTVSGTTSLSTNGVATKVALFMSNGKDFGGFYANGAFSLGIVDASENHFSVTFDTRDAQGTTQTNVLSSETYGVANIHSGSLKMGQTFVINGTSVTATTAGAALIGCDVAYMLIDTDTVNFFLDFIDAKATTGTQDYNVGFEAGGGLIIGTLMTTIDTVATGDEGSISIGVFNQDGGFSSSISVEDGVLTTDTYHLESTAATETPLATTGAGGNIADISATTSPNLTLDFTGVTGNSDKLLLFTIERIATAGGGGSADTIWEDIMAIPQGYTGGLPVKISGEAGQTASVTVSVDNAAFTATNFSIAEIGNDWFYVTRTGGWVQVDNCIVIRAVANSTVGEAVYFIDDSTAKQDHFPDIADHILRRDIANAIASSATGLDTLADARSLIELMAMSGLNLLPIAAGLGTITTYRADDSTTSKTYTNTTSGGQVTEISPDS